MLKRYVVIFAVLSVSFFFLFTGIFGENGFLCNLDLKRQLSETKNEIDKLEETIKSLEVKNSELSTEEGIREAALKLGYNVSGDEVYVFDSPSLQTAAQDNAVKFQQKKAYTPWGNGLILICALLSSGLVTFLIYTLLGKKSEDGSDYGA